MKVFMHWDMEGVSGILAREQVWFWEEGVRKSVSPGRSARICYLVGGAIVTFGAGMYLLVAPPHGFEQVIVSALLVVVSAGTIVLSVLDFNRPPRLRGLGRTQASDDPGGRA